MIIGKRINPFAEDVVTIKSHVHLMRWAQSAREGGKALYYLGHLSADRARNEKDGDHTVQFAKKIGRLAYELYLDGFVSLTQVRVQAQPDQVNDDFAYIAIRTEKPR